MSFLSSLRDRDRVAEIFDSVAEYSLYGLVFFIPISISLVEIFSVLSIIAFVIAKAARPDFKFVERNRNVFMALGALAVFLGISLFGIGPYLMTGLRAYFSKWLQYMAVFVVAVGTLGKGERIRNVVWVLMVSSLLAAFSGLSQYFFGLEFLRGREMARVSEGVYGAGSAFKHYNSFSAYLIFVLPVAISLSLMRERSRLFRAGMFSWALCLMAALLFTFSRGGWLGFLAGSCLLMLLLGGLKIVPGIILLFAGALLFVPRLWERVLFTFGSSGDAGRLSIWEGALGMIRESPFLGKGLGTFMRYFPEYTRGLGIQYAHNCYLQLWAEAGIFALMGFLVFSGIVVLSGIKKVRDSEKRSERGVLLAGFLCGAVSFLVHSFFDVQLFSVQLRVFFWVMMGVIVALGGESVCALLGFEHREIVREKV